MTLIKRENNIKRLNYVTSPKRENKIKKLKYIRNNYQLYLFILPALLIVIIFKYIPMYGTIIAFKDFNPLKGIMGSPWIGLDNFRQFTTTPDFMNMVLSTLKLSAYGLLFGFPIPLILALMIHRVKSVGLKKKMQLILYAPNFISSVVIVGMIFIFLSPIGPINQIITLLGGKSVDFMSEPSWFRSVYIISGIWQTAGWASIIYLAGLSNVSQEQTDAALIDGANIFQQIKHVDFPAIKSITVIQFILAAGNIMSIGFEKAYLMQTSMNITTSEILPTYVYKIGLQMGNYGYSTAIGLFNSVINVILLIAVDQVVKRLNEGQGL
ncbi:ABC transporter permease [Clostridium estertheticum]|uniref:Sugar ABC transporter permease n=1 Tax=Clostridium estertheticum TaxID=238834 RepID=A0A7Y3WU50_9CLOT|nr:ABC transporter permease subunit [Clostridium estertheticum]MBX4259684.1 ABC transporter permease subunit [Clostridium estertheticum]MBX4271481.1 ABC transporter permease subunit [Clostridium estertheticum]NNU77713.1 sugar ABC transporter permease [Clostridium estertheticum]WBL47995.1 ABC transporter permease subunit [Clostridium estertheticum]WLC70493.1 ABC transporter permease subunit [Clostridium estertheticum]